jgi:type I thyroxine 5'-deiodinase
MSRLIELYYLYCNYINFRFVYILEAHAQDEWPISSARWSPTEIPIRYNQTRTIEQRLEVAKDFIRDFHFPIPLVIDKPEEDLFEKLYAPWPVRIYVIDKQNRLTYKAQPSETMLELNELIEHLRLIIKSNE